MKEQIINNVEKLDTETREKLIEYAKKVTIDNNSIGLRLSHIAELIRNKAFAVDMQSREGVAEFRNFANEVLSTYFVYFTDDRINEEVEFIRRNNRLNREKILRELYQISRIKNN